MWFFPFMLRPHFFYLLVRFSADSKTIHHHFRQALAICFVLLVRQLTTAREATCQAAQSICQADQSTCQAYTKHLADKYKASDRCLSDVWFFRAKASVKHIQSIWQTSTRHLTDICQMFCTCLSDALYMLDRCFGPLDRCFGLHVRCLSNKEHKANSKRLTETVVEENQNLVYGLNLKWHIFFKMECDIPYENVFP